MGCESSILVNGGFESWTEGLPDGWEADGVQEQVIVYDGDSSVSCLDQGAEQNISLAIGQCYNLSFWYNAAEDTLLIWELTAKATDGGDTYALRPNGAWDLNPAEELNFLPSTNGWEQVTVQFTGIDTSYEGILGFYSETQAYFDDVCLYPCEIPAGDDALSATCGESLFKIDILRQRIRTDGTNYYLVVK